MIEPTTLTRLTAEQREHWDTQGYLVLPGVLATDEIERLINAVDRLDEASQRDGRAPDEFLSTLNVVEEDDAFLNLIDHPRHLGILMDLMGACIQLITSQVMVRPPTPHPGSRWHFDGPKPYPFPRANGLTPLLHLKIGWFLTDLDAPDMGNFLLIPGSHRGKFPRSDADAVALSSPSRFQEVDEIDAGVPGAEQVLLRAGDALLFHNALWHAVSRNRSEVRRKNVFFVYAPLWMRLGDRMSSSPELIARADPVRRQLLGALAEESGGVHPGDEHAPLIHLFEGKGYQEMWEEKVADYVREGDQ